MARIQELLTEIGLEAERIHMVHVSSAMASQFAEAATQMSQRIARLGPNPLRTQTADVELNLDRDENVEAEL